MTSPYCEDCQSECRINVKCPECLGSGIWIGNAVGGIDEPNWFGMRHPLNLLESCPVCFGKREIIIRCPFYGE